MSYGSSKPWHCVFAILALSWSGLGFISPAQAVEIWTGTHSGAQSASPAEACDDQEFLYPNSRAAGDLTVSGGGAICYSHGNNAACAEHPTDQFKCGGTATLTCTAGEDYKRSGYCVNVAKQPACKACGDDVRIADSVDALSGTSTQEYTDWSSSGSPFLAFTRFYSGSFKLINAPAYSRLGNAWRSNFDAGAAWVGNLGSPVVLPTSATTIHIVLPDAIEYSFKQQTGVWKPVVPRPHATSTSSIYWDQFRTDIDLKLTIATSTVEMTIPSGTKYIFDFDGLLKQIVFVDGYKQYLEYSGTLNTRVTDSNGQWLEFVYDAPASQPTYLSRVLTSDGKIFDYTYESRAVGLSAGFYQSFAYSLKTVTFPDSTPSNSADNPVTTYEYLNDAARTFLLTGVVDERGIQNATWTFDSDGRVLTSERAGGVAHYDFSYDDVNNKVTVTNPLGRQTVYTYQRVFGQIRRLVSVDGVATTNCAASNTVYAHDSNGFRNQATDAEGRISKWTRNSRGLPTTTIEGFGTSEARTTTTSWDTTRPLPTTVAGPGLTTGMSYNTAGHITGMTLTDTTTTTVPYSTNAQTRTTAFGYSTITLPAPPTVGPTGSALSDVVLTVVNGTASSGTTGWTNTTGGIAARTTAPCSVGDPCFSGGTVAVTVAHQDIAVPSGNITEVDSGLRAAKVAWKQRSNAANDDTAAVNLIFLNSGGTAIGSVRMPVADPLAWTDRERTIPVPSGTRTIRVQLQIIRAFGSSNDGYIDNVAVTLVADGTAATNPFFAITNSDALSGSTTGWTTDTGSVATSTASPCNYFACFKDGSIGTDRIYQDLVVSTDRITEIDAGSRSLEIKWLDRSTAVGNRVRAEVDFLDSTNAPIADSARVSSSQASIDSWTLRSLVVSQVPAGTRKVRLAFTVTHASYIRQPGAYFTGISAQFIARTVPQGSVEVLTSVDGPLSGTGDTVTYAYDTQARLASVTNEVGHVTQVTAWNGAGQPTSITDANGVVTDLDYDARNRLTTVTVNPGPDEAVTTTDYDAVGQITKITAPDGAFLEYTWNDARRLTTVTNNAGETITYGYNANGDVTSTTVKTSGGSIVKQQSAVFDELGRLFKSIGAASQETRYAYDRTDLLTQVTDPRSNLYAYAYDALQRLIRTTDQVSAQVNLTRDGQDNITAYSDPRSIVTNYVYNGFGEVIQESGPDLGTTVLVRDARGLATQVTDPRGIVANMTYDNAGRLLTVSYPSATAENITYTYDDLTSGNKGKGQLTGIADGTGSTARVYDALGRITSENRVIAGKTYVTAYDYNAADRLTTITYPSGRIVTYARNANGQVTSVTTQETSTAAIDTIVSGISWKPMSDLISGMTFGNGLVAGASYDSDYRLSAMTLNDGGTAVIDLGYGYGDALNLTAITDTVTSANTVGLSYTPANRLGTATGPWGTAAYAYDGVGNRTSEALTPSGGSTVTLTTALASGTNRLASVTTGGTLTRTFTNDLAGNITVDVKGSDTFTTTYNVRNRPVTVARTGSISATSSYTYNGLQQMVTRSTSAAGGPSGTLHYIYDTDGHLIAEADATTGATLKEYIWLAANDNTPIDLPLALVTDVNTSSPVLSMVHPDHLGRPIRMTDATRATIWQAVYNPFGEAYSLSGTIENNIRFPGQVFLIETGLAYNWHRHYDPSTARYTQADPLRFVDGPSVYSYVGGSPYMATDREGKLANILIQGGANVAKCLTNPACRAAMKAGATTAAAAAAAALADVGDAIWTGCEWLYRKISGYGSGGGNNDDDDGCDRQYEEDAKICRSLPTKTLKARCWASAGDRLGNCKGGRPAGPLRYND